MKTLYTGIVEPHFRYCCSVWCCCGKTCLNQLQKLQNRAARIVTNVVMMLQVSFYSMEYYTHYTSLHSLGWKSIAELIIADEKKLMVFKSLNDVGPKYMYNMFTKNSHFTERNLRSTTTDLRLRLRKSTVDRKGFHIEVPRCVITSQLSAEKQDRYISLNPS